VSTYYNLRFEHAMNILQQHPLPNNNGATSCEKDLAHIMNQLKLVILGEGRKYPTSE